MKANTSDEPKALKPNQVETPQQLLTYLKQYHAAELPKTTCQVTIFGRANQKRKINKVSAVSKAINFIERYQSRYKTLPQMQTVVFFLKEHLNSPAETRALEQGTTSRLGQLIKHIGMPAGDKRKTASDTIRNIFYGDDAHSTDTNARGDRASAPTPSPSDGETDSE